MSEAWTDGLSEELKAGVAKAVERQNANPPNDTTRPTFHRCTDGIRPGPGRFCSVSPHGPEADFDPVERIAELEAQLHRYGSHVHSGPIDQVCDLTVIDTFEVDVFAPGPPRRWKVRGKWQTEQPRCTCGLDAALAKAGKE